MLQLLHERPGFLGLMRKLFEPQHEPMAWLHRYEPTGWKAYFELARLAERAIDDSFEVLCTHEATVSRSAPRATTSACARTWFQRDLEADKQCNVALLLEEALGDGAVLARNLQPQWSVAPEQE